MIFDIVEWEGINENQKNHIKNNIIKFIDKK